MKFLIVGDIIGRPGRRTLRKALDIYKADVVIVNVENSAGGFGITHKVYDELKSMGVDVMTSGNHIWDKKEGIALLERKDLLRPANYPEGAPGKGYGIFEKKGVKFAVINLMGRIFLDPHLENPFKVFDQLYQMLSLETPILIVDFHAEATSEKWAFGIYADGRASIVYGTHTHVPTYDQLILKHGTAYTSDVGMTGCWYSAIGMEPEDAIKRFLTGIPQKYKVEEKEDTVFNAILVEVNTNTGKAISIERIQHYFKRDELTQEG
ncbi:TIGR00282 family metallophosphoesterase [Thermocrinis minervae]|uniref:TIGR00282 family metallophosphoesterase n=1 Tax=Thermocrinis minervae TaxID=381751 RepID=A0A1M6SFL4_9AQUI|nr:TIGR00282 family metallophosphoesterase [Thermocrinis minervae]SHK43268.1 hypothetical protein SAMN05444391_1006 [Thermocrinis minervae]